LAGFLDFGVRKKMGRKIPAEEEHPLYTIVSVASFSINYSKTHKSCLKYEIRHDLHKIAAYDLMANKDI